MKKLFVISLVLLSLFNLASCADITVNNNYDSIQALQNINNGGYAAAYGDWIYYARDNDAYYSPADSVLYKVKKDGTQKTKLTDDAPYYINVVNDWIYYSNMSDNRHADGGKIYKVKTDGSSRIKLNDDDGAYLNVVDNWIYYTNLSEGDYRSNQRIYRVTVDGKQKEKVNDDMSSHINVIDDWIYYLAWSLDESSDLYKAQLYKIRTNGTQRTKISDDFTSFYVIHDGWIYYNNGSDENKLYKIKLDGTSITKVADDKVVGVNARGEWIFYTTEEESLVKVKQDGTERLDIGLARYYRNINLIDEWIYYYNIEAEHMELFRIKDDGSEDIKFDIE